MNNELVDDDVMEELKEKIQNDGWMGTDATSVLANEIEDIDVNKSRNPVDTAILRFREGWEQTLHWYRNYVTPLKNNIMENMDEDDPVKAESIALRESMELWRHFEEKHDLYYKARMMVTHDPEYRDNEQQSLKEATA